MQQNISFDTLCHKVFVEWPLFSDIERKMNKILLQSLCPHAHIETDYVETTADGDGQQITYCVLCNKTFTSQ